MTLHSNEHTRNIDSISKAQAMVWARLFDKDPAARELADAGGEVAQTVEMITRLLEDGYTVDGITLHGYASDEDDTTWRTGRPGAGLGVDSDKNVSLAEERADAVYGMLVDSLRQELGDQVDQLPIQVTGGTEMRDEALNQAIAELARQRGSSVQDMVVDFNRDRHDAFTQDELDVLNQLRAHRYVSMEVSAHKTYTVTSLEYVEGEWVNVTQESDEGSVVFIPILIPWLRRRKDNSSPGYPGRGDMAALSTGPTEPRVGRPPKNIGSARGGHGSIWRSHKQPGKLNDGGNRGSRGQRNPNSSGGNKRSRGQR